MKVSQYGLQQCYLRAYNALNNAGLSQAEVDKAVLSQSYLRLEQPLVINRNTIDFPILNNATSAIPIRSTEVRLAQQDSFFCSAIAIYIALAASTSDTAFRLETYPNPAVFAVGGAVPAPLNTFYNGYMKILINKNTIVSNYPLTNFYQVPQTQQVVSPSVLTAQDQIDPSEVALWEPNINFVGTKESKITLEFPDNISAVDENTYAIIIMQGVLAQNVTLMS